MLGDATNESMAGLAAEFLCSRRPGALLRARRRPVVITSRRAAVMECHHTDTSARNPSTPCVVWKGGRTHPPSGEGHSRARTRRPAPHTHAQARTACVCSLPTSMRAARRRAIMRVRRNVVGRHRRTGKVVRQGVAPVETISTVARSGRGPCLATRSAAGMLAPPPRMPGSYHALLHHCAGAPAAPMARREATTLMPLDQAAAM